MTKKKKSNKITIIFINRFLEIKGKIMFKS